MEEKQLTMAEKTVKDLQLRSQGVAPLPQRRNLPPQPLRVDSICDWDSGEVQSPLESSGPTRPSPTTPSPSPAPSYPLWPMPRPTPAPAPPAPSPVQPLARPCPDPGTSCPSLAPSLAPTLLASAGPRSLLQPGP